MRKYIISRNLWLLAGICSILTFIINLQAGTRILLPVLNIITCILCFTNAYFNHKKYLEGNKK
jgi:hypothetical protein